MDKQPRLGKSKSLNISYITSAALFFGGVVSAQVVSVATGATTLFGTAAGQSGGFNGSFAASLPLHHIGGRGEAGLDLVWNLQPNWQAWKRAVGAVGTGVLLAIDPYPSSNIATGPSPSSPGTFGLGRIFPIHLS